jgi:hypothetical protein
MGTRDSLPMGMRSAIGATPEPGTTGTSTGPSATPERTPLEHDPPRNKRDAETLGHTPDCLCYGCACPACMQRYDATEKVAALEQELQCASDDLAFLDKVRNENVRLRAAIADHVSLRLCDCIQDESCVACRTQANLARALTKPEGEE